MKNISLGDWGSRVQISALRPNSTDISTPDDGVSFAGDPLFANRLQGSGPIRSEEALPRHVHKQVTRHGRAVFYFRRGHGPRVRLPAPNDRRFPEAYAAALAGKRAEPYDGIQRQRIETALVQSLRGARGRARKKGLDFNLDLDWLLTKLENQNFRCAITGLKFFEHYSGPALLSPYTPSIDRIEATKGYTKDNVRIVTFGANTMLHDWGDDVLKKFSRRTLRRVTL